MPPIRAISTLGCPDLSLVEAASLAREHGLSAIELRCLAGTLDLPGYFDSAFGTPRAVAQALSETGVTAVSLDTSFPLIGNDPGQRGKLCRFAEWAEALSIPSLRVFDGGKSGADAEFREATETCAWWKAIRAERGWRVDLVVETHDLLFTTALIRRFCAENPGAGILWDTHHTWRRGGESPDQTWASIRPHVRHIHVKDSVLKPSAKHPFTYVLPGEGEFPMAPLTECLKKDGYHGPLSLEWEKRWHLDLPSLHDALARARALRWW